MRPLYDYCWGFTPLRGQEQPVVVLWASGRLGLRISNAAFRGVAAGFAMT